jgi:hypothetical protein
VRSVAIDTVDTRVDARLGDTRARVTPRWLLAPVIERGRGGFGHRFGFAFAVITRLPLEWRAESFERPAFNAAPAPTIRNIPLRHVALAARLSIEHESKSALYSGGAGNYFRHGAAIREKKKPRPE